MRRRKSAKRPPAQRTSPCPAPIRNTPWPTPPLTQTPVAAPSCPLEQMLNGLLSPTLNLRARSLISRYTLRSTVARISKQVQMGHHHPASRLTASHAISLSFSPHLLRQLPRQQVVDNSGRRALAGELKTSMTHCTTRFHLITPQWRTARPWTLP